MIASVRGTVLACAGTTAIVEVGGVGLQIAVTPSHALELRVGSEARMPTALIVREDELALYGFADDDSKEIFDLLRGVSGVGPKSAMAVLATLSPGQIASAVADEDDSAFRKVSGVGPKTAKLIVISLAGKIRVAPTVGAEKVLVSTVSDNVVAALVSLGWPERAAVIAVEDAVSKVNGAERDSVPLLLRAALGNLGPGSLQGGR
ncbi:MAG: Holliday junction branch migration protein RuvA [Terrimesophilobacter sp.]